MTRRVCTGSNLGAAERFAFADAEAVAGSHPGSILYLSPSDRPADEVRDRWGTVGTPIQVRISDFDSIVADAIEQHEYEPRGRGLSAPERQRIVEAALDALDGHTHPLATRTGAAGADACSQAEDLLSLFEFAGLVDPGAILSDPWLDAVSDSVRDAVATLSAGPRRDRDVFPDEDGQRLLRSERYLRVCDSDGCLTTVLESVDALVIGPHAFYSPLETELIDAMADEVDLVTAALPLAGPALDDSLAIDEQLSGIDHGAGCA